ncbi:MAG: PilC/PilY family type IV pilus protein, partial [bacterium]
MGDPIYANPVVVGPPQERYDVIYGDQTYTDFFRQYKDRRRMVFVGGNDGMLHGFNGGFYHRGDDPNTTTAVEHGYFTKTPTDNSSGPELGDELWGFIPQELLPHLRWLTRTDYTHVYYVDLRPKITDARIFTPDADHPGGWGTILIGGFRMGGSCFACVSGSGAPAMTVTADFNGDSINETRTFYSAYFVLDITNPEKDPKLLWSFSHADLGLTTSVPTVIRANPGSSGKTDNTNAKWFMIVGSGPTGYGASSSQVSRMFAIELVNGPGVANLNVTTFSTANASSFMGDLISVDANLDYRVDVIYGGNVKKTGPSPAWSGTLY